LQTKDSPAVIIKVSTPSPKVIVSAPAPPVILSPPALALIVSSFAEPVMVARLAPLAAEPFNPERSIFNSLEKGSPFGG